jgi:hypothetical protein
MNSFCLWFVAAAVFFLTVEGGRWERCKFLEMWPGFRIQMTVLPLPQVH